jgi:hypothetical protein
MKILDNILIFFTKLFFVVLVWSIFSKTMKETIYVQYINNKEELMAWIIRPIHGFKRYWCKTF